MSDATTQVPDAYREAIQRSLVAATAAYIDQEGQFIAGKVVDRYIATGEHGRYPVLEIQPVAGTFALGQEEDPISADPGTVYAVHCFRQIAMQEVEERDIQPGMEIVLTCNGRKASKVRGRNDMYLYKIVVVNPGPARERSAPRIKDEDVPF